MTVEINNGTSWVDITPYIKFGGITFSRNDVEAPDSGRTLDGIMHRGRVAVKERMDISTVLMNRSQIATLHQLLYPETFQVRVNPYPNTDASKTMTMYSNNFKTTHVIHRANGDEMQEISFPLIEV